MSRLTRIASVLVALAALGANSVSAEPDEAADFAVAALAGRVTTDSNPLAAARVYAYQIADLSLHRAQTDEGGRFLFDRLPAGLYKIIAFKSGFLPAVVMLSRATAETTQSVELDLIANNGETAETDAGFWAVRQRIPGDVLRDIQLAERTDAYGSSFSLDVPPAAVQTEMVAMTGLREGAEYGAAQVSGGRVGIDGRMGDVEIDVTGEFSELESRAESAAMGSTQWVDFQVSKDDRASVGISSRSHQMVTAAATNRPVDFESHSVTWTQRVGSAGRSDFRAQYTQETNFYSQGRFQPREIPDASRALRVEGSYTTPLTERATFQAGFRYRGLDSFYRRQKLQDKELLPEETVELYGRGGVQVKPAVIVEYGLYSKLRDGGVSLMPQGGVVVQLGDGWQASTLASHRLDQNELPDPMNDFSPVFYSESGSCDLGEQYCYQVALSRLWSEDESFTIGAIHREFGETLRLFFDQDFYDRLESLFLVRGDQLPELQVGLTRRLTPDILTRFESNLAAGGGGIVQAANRRSYENEIRYLVTSLDTHFEQTETGVFLAFHRLEQELNPIARAGRGYQPFEMERLQMRVTQDLGVLHSLAWNWAVHLNMELSRGTAFDRPELDEEELRKRLTGGIAVKF